MLQYNYQVLSIDGCLVQPALKLPEEVKRAARKDEKLGPGQRAHQRNPVENLPAQRAVLQCANLNTRVVIRIIQ